MKTVLEQMQIVFELSSFSTSSLLNFTTDGTFDVPFMLVNHSFFRNMDGTDCCPYAIREAGDAFSKSHRFCETWKSL